MRRIVTMLTIFAVFLSLTGCEDPTDPSKPTVVNIAAIGGVTPPATGAVPVTAITPTDQYTGNVTWNGSPASFAASTTYTATMIQNNNRAAVYVNDGSILELRNGTISGNTTTTSSNTYGGGVYVSGSFTMQGNASVTDNIAITTATSTTISSYGGGVYVAGSGSFTMEDDASVSGNTAIGTSYRSSYGGGVYVAGFGSFTMRDNTVVSGNTAASTASGTGITYGGGVSVNNGSFIMQDNASISGNITSTPSISYGGGVHISNSGTFTMQDDATVSANTGVYGGGGVYVENSGSSFTMKGYSSVFGNISRGSAGGVSVSNSGKFIMQDDASVYGNTIGSTGYGGGVELSYSSNFIMQGNASVHNNNGGWYGGGVYLSQSTFTMKDNATVSGNTCGSSRNGGGVYVGYIGIFTIQGGTIYGNSAGEHSNIVKNDSGTSINGNGAALYKSSGTAQYGSFNGESWVRAGDLSSTDKTIQVANGILLRPLPRTYNESVQRVTFTGSTATVIFDDLEGHDIYLVKVNTSGVVVNAANTGGASVMSPSLSSTVLASVPQDTLPRMGHPDADIFNANPPPIPPPGRPGLRNTFVPPVVGDTRMFWVEEFYSSGTWVQKQATLRATGNHGNIWVMNENYDPITNGGNKINTARAQTLADKFDIIYPATTNLLGYEYGGGPGGDGGKDGDPKIQILIYDIVNASGVVQAGGYFWGKDFYEQSQLGTQRTNLAEIFYVNTSTASSGSDYVYSLLVHEFQHMINFNMKTVKYGRNSATWYNEMLSMMAEDIIASLISIAPTNNSHPIHQRIPTFLTSYNEVGMTEWGTGAPNAVSSSYAKGYTFGAYLMRNYGGADLLRRILANNTTNIDSVTSTLNEISPRMTFEQALSRFGEAMIYSGPLMPASAVTFDKTVTNTITGYTYTAHGFDIWNDFMYRPVIFDLTQKEMRPHSVTVHSMNEWKNRSGNVSITLDRPSDSNVEFYLMVK